MLFKEKSLFTVRTIQDPQIQNTPLEIVKSVGHIITTKL
jgi:hypothetical protein